MQVSALWITIFRIILKEDSILQKGLLRLHVIGELYVYGSYGLQYGGLSTDFLGTQVLGNVHLHLTPKNWLTELDRDNWGWNFFSSSLSENIAIHNWYWDAFQEVWILQQVWLLTLTVNIQAWQEWWNMSASLQWWIHLVETWHNF